MLDGDQKRRQRDHEDRRAMHHELAGLVAYAFHDPKNLPSYKPLSAEPPRQIVGDADSERVRGYFIGLAMKSKSRPAASRGNK